MNSRVISMHSMFFTLVELLVVIAIISILASMLLPALKTARDKAKSLTCLNNMKQHGNAYYLYSSDYGNYYPAQYSRIPVTDTNQWLGQVYGYLKGWDLFSATTITHWTAFHDKNYYDSHKMSILRCKSRGYKANSSGKVYSYGYNRFAGDASFNRLTTTPVSLARIKSPSGSMIELEFWNSVASWGNFTSIDPEVARHSGGRNALYVDGHVKFMHDGEMKSLPKKSQFWSNPQ